MKVAKETKNVDVDVVKEEDPEEGMVIGFSYDHPVVSSFSNDQ